MIEAEAAETKPAPLPSEANAWRIIGITSAGHALCHISELVSKGILLALIAEFTLHKDQVTLLVLPSLVLMGVGAVPAGIWTDRWGARRVMTVYFFWVAAAAIAVAMARTVWALAGAMTLLGAAISLYHPAGLAMIAHGCRTRGRAMGINGVAGSIGVAIGPALGAYMASLGSWRSAYLIVAALALASGIVALLLRIDESPVSGAGSHAPVSSNGQSERAATGMWLLLAAMTLGGLNYRCLVTALPTYLSAGDGTASLARGGTLALIVLLLGGVGQLFGGHRADKTEPRKLYLLLIAGTIPMALVMAHVGGTAAIIAAGVLAICMFGQQPIENTIMAQITSPARRSTFYGIKFILTFGVGALGAQLVGLVWEHTGTLSRVFDVFAVGAAAMALLALLFSLRQKQVQASTVADAIEP